MSNQLKRALNLLGLDIIGNKVSRASLRKVFGAKYIEPEWVAMNDYKVNTPFDYISMIDEAEEDKNRVMMPSSFLIANYGEHLNEYGDKTILVGLVYQYSMAKNPRNVHYAYRLFQEDEIIAQNAGLPSVHNAKAECSDQAKSIIEDELYDIS